MSDLGEPMKSSILERLRAGICDDTCRVMDTASGCACAEAADRIEQLEAALRAIDEQFAEAAQDDCENGVRWLNKRAAEKYLYEYPHTSAAISFAKKVARAAVGEERT